MWINFRDVSSWLICFTLLIEFETFFATRNGPLPRQGVGTSVRDEFMLRKKLHKLKALSRQAIKRLANLNDYQTFYENILKKLLRVRIPGTIGHHEVKVFIIHTLEDCGWTVKKDEFEDKTPLGPKKFTNIIATLDPKADRQLALAAHYDSKLITPENGKYFIGATDSAVPVAMLLDLAKVLGDKFQKRKSSNPQPMNVSPMIIILDGEEAFVKWTEKDSIYGARHLANALSVSPHHNEQQAAHGITGLDALDAFVLLDLIGYKEPQFLDLHKSTTLLYQHLQDIENRLTQKGDLEPHMKYFPGAPNGPLRIEDDHVPFMRQGVPILHLIAIPFPKVWHTLDDDAENLDQTSIEQLLKIFRIFVLEYFHLE